LFRLKQKFVILAVCGILYAILYQCLVDKDFKPFSVAIDMTKSESRKYLEEGWQVISREKQPGYVYVYSKDKADTLNVQLPEKTNWTLRLKLQFAKSGQNIKVYANETFIGEARSYEGKDIGKWYFTLPKDVAVQGLNRIRIENSDPSLKILYEGIAFKNYRGALESRGAFVLLDSPRHIKFGRLLLAMLIWASFIILVETSIIKRLVSILGVIEKDIFKKSIFLTYMPFLSLLILLCLVSLFSPYQVIISRRYFWGGLILFYIVGKLILIVLHIRKAKKELPRYLQAEWIKTNLTNGFVLTFMLLLVICAILMICKEKKAADFVAIVGYILLACSLVMRLVKLKKES
jgi:hypothetical protein